MRTKKSNINMFFQRLTKLYPYIPHVLLIASITAILFLLLTGMTSLLMTALMIFVPCIIGSLYLIFTRKSMVEHIPENVYILPVHQDRLRKIFGIAAALMLICLLSGQYNSILYFVLLIGLYLIIILQLLTKNPKPGFVIFSLLYTTAVMILPLVLTPAYYYDGSDVIVHTNYIISILETGVTIPSDMTIYGIFCGMHIFAGVGVLLTSLAPHTSMFALITLAYLGVSIFVYLLSKQYCKNVTIGLLALYIFLSLPLVTGNLVTYAPFFVASLYFSVLLYLILRKEDGLKYQLFILAIPLVLASLLTHHAEHLPMLFIISVLLIGNFFVQNGDSGNHNVKYFNISIILLYLLSGFVYLYYHYLNKTLSYILWSIRMTEGNSVSYLVSSTNTEYVDYLFSWASGSYVLICTLLTLIGMYMLFTHSIQNPKKHLLAFFILIFFIIFIPGVTGSLPIISSLHVYRWRGILAVVFAVVMAIGLISLSSDVQYKIKWKYTGACISGFICLLLLVSPCISYVADNDVIQLSGLDVIHKSPANVANEHFNEMDMAMFMTFTNRISSEDTYAMDNEGVRYIKTYVATESLEKSIIPLFTKNLIENTDIYTYNTVLLREKHFTERGLLYTTVRGSYTSINPNKDTLSTFANNIHQHHTIYQNGGDVVYNI